MERRLETRLLCADLVQICWGDRKLEGLLEDISPQGACVQLDESIPPGEMVSIAAVGAGAGTEVELPLFVGLVTYCARLDTGYSVGILFAGRNAWSSAVFEPQHLLDPAELVS